MGRPYADYKQTLCRWMPSIPSQWHIRRLKFITIESRGGVWGTEYDNDGTIVLRSTDQTIQGSWSIIEPARRALSVSERDAAILKEGDLVVTKSSGSSDHIGKTTVVDRDVATLVACFSNFMQRIRLESRVYPRFYWYVMNSEFARKQFDYQSNTTTGLANLGKEVIGELLVAEPNHCEQVAIADFLDRETSRIDGLIAKKRRLLELLEEKRLAVITHAVTKGLDTTVRMKDSGIDWLGQIPAHWQAMKVKFASSVEYGVGGEIDTTLTEGTALISLPNVAKNGELVLETHPYCVLTEAEKLSLLLQKGDLIFNWRNGSSDHLGKTALFDLDEEYTHVSFLLRLRIVGRHDSRFVRYFLNGLRATGFFAYSKTGVNNTFNKEELKNLWVASPPISEQQDIAVHIFEHTRRIDEISYKLESAISLLQESRSALITAAVTGKIDVRAASTDAALQDAAE